MDMVQNFRLIKRKEKKSPTHTIQKRFITLITVGSLRFSDSMETDDKTGSVLVGKTPEAVSALFEVEVSI